MYRYPHPTRHLSLPMDCDSPLIAVHSATIAMLYTTRYPSRPSALTSTPSLPRSSSQGPGEKGHLLPVEQEGPEDSYQAQRAPGIISPTTDRRCSARVLSAPH
jgi:hypothetical protein